MKVIIRAFLFSPMIVLVAAIALLMAAKDSRDGFKEIKRHDERSLSDYLVVYFSTFNPNTSIKAVVETVAKAAVNIEIRDAIGNLHFSKRVLFETTQDGQTNNVESYGYKSYEIYTSLKSVDTYTLTIISDEPHHFKVTINETKGNGEFIQGASIFAFVLFAISLFYVHAWPQTVIGKTRILQYAICGLVYVASYFGIVDLSFVVYDATILYETLYFLLLSVPVLLFLLLTSDNIEYLIDDIRRKIRR